MQYVPSKHYAEGPEIFAHCQAIARRYDLYELAVFQTTVTSTVWDEAARHWVVTTDRGDRMTATFVICANGTLAKPRLADHRRHGDVRGDVVPHVAVGLRVHRAGTSSTSTTRSSASSAPAPAPCRSSPTSARRPRSCTSSSARRRRSTSATTGRPIPSGRPAGRPDWQTKRRAKIIAKERETGRAQQGAAQRDHPRGEDPPPGERQHRRHDADPPPHRRDRRGPGDGRGAEALVHDHVQAAVLPQRLPADVQPAQRPPRRHPRRGDHEDRPEGPGVPRQDLRARRADLRHRVRGPADRHLQPHRRRGRRSSSATSTPTASARCSASTPTASRTCSSWAATRRRSSST